MQLKYMGENNLKGKARAKFIFCAVLRSFRVSSLNAGQCEKLLIVSGRSGQRLRYILPTWNGRKPSTEIKIARSDQLAFVDEERKKTIEVPQ